MKSLLIAMFAIGVHFAGVAAVSAQQARPERPYRGLFGGGVGNAEQLLSVRLGVGGGYDDNILAGLIGKSESVSQPGQDGGGFGALSAELAYALNRTRVNFSASVMTSSRFSPELPNNLLGSHGASVGGSFEVAKDTRVMLSHSTTYQPFMTWSLFPTLTEFPIGEPAIASQDLAVGDEEYFVHATDVSLSHDLTRRAAVSFWYGHHLSDFAGDDRDLKTQSGAGRFTLGLARGLGLRLGYGYAEGRSATLANDGTVRNHTVDAGVDFSRSLSFSRRTTLTFGTGSSVIVDNDHYHYRVIGNARLNREIRRTWHAALAYDRDVGFLETFSDPVFSDSASVSVGGLFNRRMSFMQRRPFP